MLQVLSTDQMIALRLSTPNSDLHAANTPDLPRKVITVGGGSAGSVGSGGSAGCIFPSPRNSLRRVPQRSSNSFGGPVDRPRPTRLAATSTSSSGLYSPMQPDFLAPPEPGVQSFTLPTGAPSCAQSRFAKGYVHPMHHVTPPPAQQHAHGMANDVTSAFSSTQHHQVCEIGGGGTPFRSSIVAPDAYRVTANGSVIKRRSHQVSQFRHFCTLVKLHFQSLHF